MGGGSGTDNKPVCNCQYEAMWNAIAKKYEIVRTPSGNCPDHGSN